MSHIRRIQGLATLVLLLGLLGLLSPVQAAVRSPLDTCDQLFPVANCESIPGNVAAYCATCEMQVACHDFHSGNCFYAYCDHITE